MNNPRSTVVLDHELTKEFENSLDFLEISGKNYLHQSILGEWRDQTLFLTLRSSGEASFPVDVYTYRDPSIFQVVLDDLKRRNEPSSSDAHYLVFLNENDMQIGRIFAYEDNYYYEEIPYEWEDVNHKVAV